MSDYPDHLNPFKKTGLRESFRSMRSAFNVRFRKKEHRSQNGHSPVTTTNNAGTRLRHDGMTNGAQVPRSETIIGTIRTGTRTGTPEMLPRSHIKERAARSQTMDFRTAANPFDDDKTVVDSQKEIRVNGKIDLANGTGTDTARRHRRKKRAPLPPGGRNNLLVPGDQNSSQWSIDSYTSYDTDYSTTAHTQSENEDAHSENAERLKDIQEISKEIQVFCDTETPAADAVIIKEEQVTEGVKQEIQQESPPVDDRDNEDVSSSNCTDTLEKEKEVEIVMTEEEEKDNKNLLPESEIKDKPEEVKEEEAIEEHVAPPIDEINNNNVQVQDDPVKLQDATANGDVEELKEVNPEVKQPEVKEKDCDTSEQEKSPTDDVVDAHDVDSNSQSVAYVDRKSIYIAGSTDNLDVQQFNHETTLYITGSCDQLDGSPAPTPKIRKHKLGREVLLGSTEEGLNSNSEKQ